MTLPRKIFIPLAIMLGLGLTACGGESKTSAYKELQNELKSWSMAKSAKAAYPGMTPEKAMKTYANQKMFDYFRAEKDPSKRHLMAAMVYLSYAQLNTRARPAYCGNMNVDISDFKKSFERQHKEQDAAVSTVLAQHNLTRDDIWEQNERYMMTNVKNDLMRAGGLHGSRAMCSDIRKKPMQYAQPFNFTKIIPHAALQLKQAQRHGVTQQAELKAVPTLRR